MQKHHKWLLYAGLSLCLALGAPEALPASATSQTTPSFMGECGTTATWLYDEGKLIISGTGEMEGYAYEHFYGYGTTDAP